MGLAQRELILTEITPTEKQDVLRDLSLLDRCSYYSSILEYAFDVIEVEGAYSHEAEGLEQRHVHVLSLVVIHRFVVRVLPNHRHFTLGHQVLDALVNFADH